MGAGGWGLGEPDHLLSPIPQPPSPDYVLLLNPDTVVHPGAIEALAAFLGEVREVAAVQTNAGHLVSALP